MRFKGFGPTVGVTYAVLPRAWDVFVSYSRPFKSPNVDDFAAEFPDYASNIQLKPQQANAYELGTRAFHGPWTLKSTWFYASTAKEILFNPLDFQSQNFDTRRMGLESSVRFELPSRLHSSLTYTVMDARFHKGPFASNTIPGTPRHTFRAGVGVSPLPLLWMDLDWLVVDDFFRINDVQNKLGKELGYNVLNLIVQYSVPHTGAWHTWPAMDAYVKFENLTNQHYNAFTSSNGKTLLGAGEYPMPSFGITGGVTVRF